MSTNDLVDTIKSGDNVKANKAFNEVMAGKLKDALDAKKVEVASSIGQKSSDEVEIEIPEEE